MKSIVWNDTTLNQMFIPNETPSKNLHNKEMNKAWGFHSRGYRDQRIIYHYYTEIQTVNKLYTNKPACKDTHNKDMDIHAGSIMIDHIMSVLRFRSY